MSNSGSNSGNIHFHFNWQDYFLLNNDNANVVEENVKEIMKCASPERWWQFFSDRTTYNMLRSQEGCIRVDITKVKCYHSQKYVMGLQVTYKCKFLDGTIINREAPVHNYNYGYYSYHGGRQVISTLKLRQDEYIVNVRTNQGEIIDKITFVTNHREVSFGGKGGDAESIFHYNPTQRVIAFAGTEHGVLCRIGYFTESMNWEILKPIILLRTLVQRNRAVPLLFLTSPPITTHKKDNLNWNGKLIKRNLRQMMLLQSRKKRERNNMSSYDEFATGRLFTKEQLVIRELVLNTSDDMIKYISSYLIGKII